MGIYWTMSEISKLEISASMGDERRGSGEIEISYYTKNQISLNFLKKLFFYWGIALFCIFIPVLHFLLVPIFFFLGIFIAVKSLKSKARILSGNTTCPYCQKNIKIAAQALLWPITEICQNCVNTVRINPKS